MCKKLIRDTNFDCDVILTVHFLLDQKNTVLKPNKPNKNTADMKTRDKQCEACKTAFPTMYRIQYTTPKMWVFVCEQCLLRLKKDNPAYTYGGTWKL
ncbi:hypothetical protein [Polaribacter irgensii]|uniref:hypothetical protein n=1 Tax=Polaribacter irgensii TaxID=531 RepID=UPI0002E09310|nr:hypothetical protein [Polaribacter irgensii]